MAAQTDPVPDDGIERFGAGLEGKLYNGRPAIYAYLNLTSPAAIDRLVSALESAREWMTKADSDNAAIQRERDAARNRRPR